MKGLSREIDSVGYQGSLVTLYSGHKQMPLIKRKRAYLYIRSSDIYDYHFALALARVEELVKFLGAHLRRSTDGRG